MNLKTAACSLQSRRGSGKCRLVGVMLCALVSTSAFRAIAAAEIIDRVLAVVSGSLITLSDVNAARDLHLMEIAEGADPVRDVLPRLIDRALILAEVERYAPPEPDPETLSLRVQAVRAMFASVSAFETALAKVGFDEKHLRETLRQDLRILAYLDQRFTVQPPADADLGRYYREHPGTFTQNGQLTPFEQARPTIVEAVTAERRQRLVDEWVAGLRRRAEITVPSVALKPPLPR